MTVRVLGYACCLFLPFFIRETNGLESLQYYNTVTTRATLLKINRTRDLFSFVTDKVLIVDENPRRVGL